jgi:predicted small lipoprotein YifL
VVQQGSAYLNSSATGVAMNSQSVQVCSAAVAIAALTLLLAACGNKASLDTRAAEPNNEITRPAPSLDPVLDRLEAVTHHG